MAKAKSEMRLELKAKNCSLEIVVVNETTKNLKFDSEYFYRGKWWSSLSQLLIKPEGASSAVVTNRGGIASHSGVGGGLRFHIEDTSPEKYVIMGYKKLITGGYKTFIMCTSDKQRTPEHGYNGAKDSSIKFVTQEGYVVTAKIGYSRIGAGKLVEFKVSEPESKPESDKSGCCSNTVYKQSVLTLCTKSIVQ